MKRLIKQHNTTTTAGIAMKRGDRSRRGVAMLMVVIALVVTTVLTTAILTSPDRMGPIAENAQSGAKARWSAESAGNFTVAAIEQDVAATDVGGLFKDKWDIALGAASVIVTNTEGEVPTDDDRNVIITIDSKSGGISETVQRSMTVTPPAEPAEVVDTRMGELAIMATESFKMLNSSVQTWELAREEAQYPPRIGLAFDSRGVASVNGSRFNGAFVVDAGASPSFVTWLDTMTNGGVIQLPVKFPAGTKDRPDFTGVTEHLANIARPADGYQVLEYGMGDLANITPGRYESMTLSGGAEVRLGDGTYVFEDVQGSSFGRINITGDVRIIVNNRFRLSFFANVFIEEGAKLHLWAGNEFEMSTAFITNWQAPSLANPDWYKSMTEYMSPNNVLVEVDTGGNVVVKDGSVMIGSIHAPWAYVEIDGSTLIGRATAGEIWLQNSTVKYDPALDSGQGYTNLQGPLYTAEGDPIPGLETALDAVGTNDPNVAATALASAVQAAWTADGAPKVSASGYWDATSKKREKLHGNSYKKRERDADLFAWKARWLGDDKESRNAETIANLEDDDGS